MAGFATGGVTVIKIIGVGMIVAIVIDATLVRALLVPATMRLLGRWMRMITIPNQSSVPKAYEQFDEAGRMHPGPLYDRVVDVMEELVRFTWLTRDRADTLVDRYSERVASFTLPTAL